MWALALATFAGLARSRPKQFGARARAPLRLGFASAGLVMGMLAAISMPGCGGAANTSGSGATGTPAGTYTLDVKGTITSGTATITHDIKLTLTVH